MAQAERRGTKGQGEITRKTAPQYSSKKDGPGSAPVGLQSRKEQGGKQIIPRILTALT